MIGRLQAPAAGSLPNPAFLWEALKQRRLWAAALAVLLIAAVVAAFAGIRSSAKVQYVTQPVMQQDLTQNVTASGTVNAQNTVTVGTQVSGTIQAIYVDYNSKVRKGQVLARLDPSQLQAQLQQAQASLAQAQAQAAAQGQTAGGAAASIQVAQQTSAAQAANAQAAQAAIATAQANVSKAQSGVQLAQQTLSRDRTLLSQGFIAQSQYDSDNANLQSMQSGVVSAQAALAQARAQAASSANQAQASSAQTQVDTAQAGASSDQAAAAQAAVAAAQAQVQQDELNLQRAVITSPVDGTVVDRAVSVGQTVAASLQTPTLFTIAQDLHKMEADISVGEPDIGNLKAGDAVSFSVLAYPNETFNGTVSQVRVNPTTVNNVVTYTVITLVDNAQGKLLPGMTANASIAVKTAKNALVVPLEALSYRPSSGSARTHRRTQSGTASSKTGSSATASAGAPWGQTSGSASGATTSGSRSAIFVDQNGKATPVPVRIDLVSGTLAAVTPLRGTLNANDQVITADGSSTASPRAGSSGSSRSLGSSGAMGGGMGGATRGIH